MKIKFKRLEEDAIVPKYNHETDSGIDLFSITSGTIYPGETKMIETGIAWEPEIVSVPVRKLEATELIDEIRYWDTAEKNPFKTCLKLEGRSGLGSKGIDVFGGVVDQDYRGEIKVLLYNSTSEPFFFKRGDRIAQGIIYLIPSVELEEITEVNDTDRGAKGFGESGK